MKKDKKPDKVIITRSGGRIEIFGEVDIEVLTRSMYGFPQKVDKKEKNNKDRGCSNGERQKA